MLAVAEMGEFFTKVIGKELVIEAEEDLLNVPENSGQGVHALQGMLANSILHENSTRHHPTDLNQALRALDSPSLRMADLFAEDRGAGSSSAMLDEQDTGAGYNDADHNKERTYRPMPFLDQGMLSFYMHVDEEEVGELATPMTALIQDDGLALMPESEIQSPVLH